MIKAQSLYFAVLVCLMVSILTGLVLSIALFYHKVYLQNTLYEKLEYNAGSGVNYLLANEPDSTSKPIALDLYGNEEDTVIIKKKDWGLYRIGYVYAIHGRDTVRRVFMYGSTPDSITSAALYLADQGRPVLFAGKTRINGTCYLPASGVKRANIDGNYFTGDSLVNGKIKKSGKTLPPVNTQLIRSLQWMINPASWHKNNAFEIAKEWPYTSMERSFEDKTLVFYSKGPITVRRKNISGNVLIVSDTVVSLEPDTRLSDVIIAAPRVYVGSGVKGNIQVFASDTLVVEKNTILQYPSTLAILEIDSVDNSASLQIGEGSSINGNVLLYVDFLERPKSSLVIAERAKVSGQIYANGYTQLDGIVYGNLISNRLLVKTSFAVYENHLFNAEIDYGKRSRYFAGNLLVKGTNVKKIVKWLY